MPDQYGRWGYNDFMGIANATSSIGNSFAKSEQRAEDKKVKDATDEIVSYAQNNGGMQALLNMPPDQIKGRYGLMGYANATEMYRQTEEGKAFIQKNQNWVLSEKFKGFQTGKQYVNDMYKQGNTAGVINGLEKLSEDFPVPHRIKMNADTGNFDVEYFHRETGKYQPAGQMSVEDAMKRVFQMGEKEYFKMGAQSAATVREKNNEMLKKPLNGKDNKGARYHVVPQKNPYSPNSVEIFVYDEKTNQQQVFKSYEEMHNAGIFTENLGREKDLAQLKTHGLQAKKAKADIEYTKKHKGGPKNASSLVKTQNQIFNDAIEDAQSYYIPDEQTGQFRDPVHKGPVSQDEILQRAYDIYLKRFSLYAGQNPKFKGLGSQGGSGDGGSDKASIFESLRAMISGKDRNSKDKKKPAKVGKFLKKAHDKYNNAFVDPKDIKHTPMSDEYYDLTD